MGGTLRKTALELIHENKRTKSTELEIGCCDLIQIPEEISELTWLETLILADNCEIWTGANWYFYESENGGSNKGLLDLKPLSNLSGLRELVIAGTKVEDLSPIKNLSELRYLDISSTNVTNLEQLISFEKLETLDVSYIVQRDYTLLSSLTSLKIIRIHKTSVSDLTPLSKLPHLEALSFMGEENGKAVDFKPLVSLESLQALDIWSVNESILNCLSNCRSLRFLSIWSPKFSDLEPLKNLTKLQGLFFSSSPVTNLSLLKNMTNLEFLDASNTDVVDISPIKYLEKLQELFISDTKVTDITPLKDLISLRTLGVNATKITDLSPISKLINLHSLNISETKISDLTPLNNLNSLEWIDASSTKISDLTPLAGHKEIIKLNISNTNVSDLSPLRHLFVEEFPILENRFSVKPGLSVINCPLKTPPPEIVSQGSEAIDNFFKEIKKGDVAYLYEAKLLILGEGGAGKTSLLRRLYKPDQPLPTEQDTTKGIDIHRYKYTLKNGQEFNLNIWDFGGQEIYHATHQFFLTRRSVYILVDDTRKNHKSVSDDGFKYWLDLISVFGENSTTIIFQNEKGGRSKAIDFAGIKAKYGNVVDCFSGNLEQLNAVDKLRLGIEYYASNLNHIGDELPASWVKIRSEIEERAKSVFYISLQEYFDIYRKHINLDQTKALHLSQYLHDLGVFLHFQENPLLKRTVILQNEWATEAVFKILDDEIVKRNFGRFDHSDYQRLWQDSKYSDMHLELLELMKRFELCYELVDSSPKTMLAPQLLKPTKPDALEGWKKIGDLTLRYRYDFMPKGIISRLMVRLNRYVSQPEMAWNNGILFENNDTEVIVELMPSGSDIEIRARGPESNILLNAVSMDLEAINNSFHTLDTKVDKLIPCICKECLVSFQPELFSHKNLLKRKFDKRFSIECPKSYEYVDVIELLDGIRSETTKDSSRTVKTLIQPDTHIKIFLASSSELKDDRDRFDLYFRQKNDRLIKRGKYLEIIRWEVFLDQISETRKQDDYNDAVLDCDIFICLFFSKTGTFTEEEFDIAHEQFKKTSKPKIYTYFKDDNLKSSDINRDDIVSLLEFKEKLRTLGHFHSTYYNIEDLILKFGDQLDLLFDKGIF